MMQSQEEMASDEREGQSGTGSDDSWFFAGLTSSFPDLASSSSSSTSGLGQKLKLSDTVVCPHGGAGSVEVPAAKVFQVPQTAMSSSRPAQVSLDDALSSVGLESQVLVFQHRGKFYAVDHQCPHRSYPLSKGAVYDIEDFGIVFSAGITCPKHGWAFDLHTGESDRGAYQLRVWKVELRERPPCAGELGDADKEVWVQKR